mmetsp:Transcript_47264/g.143114  ORF Transcript_47264/g.143114 Transcript_47264/m.143114 type:complete len:300 (+) Transcript_47264:1335-2234(+)
MRLRMRVLRRRRRGASAGAYPLLLRGMRGRRQGCRRWLHLQLRCLVVVHARRLLLFARALRWDTRRIRHSGRIDPVVAAVDIVRALLVRVNFCEGAETRAGTAVRAAGLVRFVAGAELQCWKGHNMTLFALLVVHVMCMMFTFSTSIGYFCLCLLRRRCVHEMLASSPRSANTMHNGARLHAFRLLVGLGVAFRFDLRLRLGLLPCRLRSLERPHSRQVRRQKGHGPFGSRIAASVETLCCLSVPDHIWGAHHRRCLRGPRRTLAQKSTDLLLVMHRRRIQRRHKWRGHGLRRWHIEGR